MAARAAGSISSPVAPSERSTSYPRAAHPQALGRTRHGCATALDRRVDRSVVDRPQDPLEMNVDERLASSSRTACWESTGGDGTSCRDCSIAVECPFPWPSSSMFGTTAAYLGGWLDESAMRIVDMVLAFP